MPRCVQREDHLAERCARYIRGNLVIRVILGLNSVLSTLPDCDPLRLHWSRSIPSLESSLLGVPNLSQSRNVLTSSLLCSWGGPRHCLGRFSTCLHSAMLLQLRGAHNLPGTSALWLPERAGTGTLWVIHRESLARENHTDSEHSCPKWRLTAALSFPGAHSGLAFELPLPSTQLGSGTHVLLGLDRRRRLCLSPARGLQQPILGVEVI